MGDSSTTTDVRVVTLCKSKRANSNRLTILLAASLMVSSSLRNTEDIVVVVVVEREREVSV